MPYDIYMPYGAYMKLDEFIVRTLKQLPEGYRGTVAFELFVYPNSTGDIVIGMGFSSSKVTFTVEVTKKEDKYVRL
jgi:hypothetical protein